MNDDELQRQENLERILHSPSYRPAYKDVDFLDGPRLRPQRMELELLKPELTFEQLGIHSTIVVFGSTRILEPAVAERKLERAKARLADTPRDARRRRAVQRAERLLAKSRYYDVARQFARLVTECCREARGGEYVIMTGGGPLNSTRFYMLHLYQYAFQFFQMGYASALAWVLFVIILAFTLITLKSSEAWVFYAGGRD